MSRSATLLMMCQPSKQGLVGVEVIVPNASTGVAAAVSATPDATRGNGVPRSADIRKAPQAVASKLTWYEAA